LDGERRHPREVFVGDGTGEKLILWFFRIQVSFLLVWGKRQMATERMRTGQWVRVVCGGLGLFAGLCSIFALVVTAAEGWQEHAQAQWPEATARVQGCGVDLYTHRSEAYWIDCRISYLVGGEEIVTEVHSRTTPAPSKVIWQYPAAQIGLMQEWVDEHPPGTPIVVHYDPANHKKAVLLATDMPLGGRRTPANLRLLGIAAGSCVLLLAIARITRPSSAVVVREQ
jgi:hypothetical protein